MLTGAGGQLGRSLVAALAPAELAPLSHAALDVRDAGAVEAAVAGMRSDVVVHCAALTDTARCEREPQLARAVNGEGALNVARACQRAGARLIAISTNEVFDGRSRQPYRETDATRPLNAYGLSKLDGECLAASACADTLIVRTAWLYGDGEHNFPARVLAMARGQRAVRLVDDEVASPTSCDDLAAAIASLIAAGAAPGVYHLVNAGEASRYDWGRHVLRLAGLDVAVEATTTAALRASGYDGPPKPAYSALANTGAAVLGITLRPWRDALAAWAGRRPLVASRAAIG